MFTAEAAFTLFKPLALQARLHRIAVCCYNHDFPQGSFAWKIYKNLKRPFQSCCVSPGVNSLILTIQKLKHPAGIFGAACKPKIK
jgi:hypothetical protein